ncbi:hypothetical protein HanPSC8_Chr15g0655601 [Helianthus annuus]|nr:hypothetical protein HanPSC8_Chr15g0655601 [Helianthus annuus]
MLNILQVTSMQRNSKLVRLEASQDPFNQNVNIHRRFQRVTDRLKASITESIFRRYMNRRYSIPFNSVH